MSEPDVQPLRRAVTEALALLGQAGAPARRDMIRHDIDPLPSLLARCEAVVQAAREAPPAPVATLHHFACTGGTLIAKCIAVMPNTVLLNEIDPLSRIDLNVATQPFAPTDLLAAMHYDLRCTDPMIAAVFRAAVSALQAGMLRQGQSLVIRDHAHSQFCTDADPAKRPTLRALLAETMALRSLVTVRHPIEAFLSLSKNGWIHFQPGTLEEYCRRKLLFLDAYHDVRIIRYEDLVADPEPVLERICGILGLCYRPGAPDLIALVTISGGSGRSGNLIAPRPRRPVPSDIVAECRQSGSYATLCARLGYDPAVE